MKKRSEYIGLSPLDIYKDRNGNREVYIHLHQESFLKAEKPTITEAIISNEYLKQARKLENMSMKYFENNISKKDFNRIIDIQKKAYEQNYSSEVLSEKGQRSIDHIKPLVKGGEHEVWNTVPMYRPYNSSKRDKDMEEWYQEQDFYSEERLQKIYEWQEYAYNKYSKK